MTAQSESKHTPGPWVADGFAVRVSGRGLIATCPAPQADGVFECASNVYLIAAAPSLLEALKAVLDDWDAHGGSALTKARAAIARAEGRAP